MADVCFVDATRCMIVRGEVASEIAVQTVLRALEVARLRQGAFHGGLSFSLDRVRNPVDHGHRFRMIPDTGSD
jgi:hypothetical protein